GRPQGIQSSSRPATAKVSGHEIGKAGISSRMPGSVLPARAPEGAAGRAAPGRSGAPGRLRLPGHHFRVRFAPFARPPGVRRGGRGVPGAAGARLARRGARRSPCQACRQIRLNGDKSHQNANLPIPWSWRAVLSLAGFPARLAFCIAQIIANNTAKWQRIAICGFIKSDFGFLKEEVGTFKADTSRRFDAVDQRLDAVDQRFDKLIAGTSEKER
ncbi:MAG TPA: hypothetical protein VFN97_19485, partial [Actinospica sp.]|nr:hypothetical protein [Actinospica sp.]